LSAPLSPHFSSSVFSNPTSFWVRLWATTIWVVHFLTIPHFECAFEPSLPFVCALSHHFSGIAFSNPTSFRVCFWALTISFFHLGRSPITMRPSFFLGRSPITTRPILHVFYLGRSPITMRPFLHLSRSLITIRPLFLFSSWVGHPLQWDYPFF